MIWFTDWCFYCNSRVAHFGFIRFIIRYLVVLVCLLAMVYFVMVVFCLNLFLLVFGLEFCFVFLLFGLLCFDSFQVLWFVACYCYLF